MNRTLFDIPGQQPGGKAGTPSAPEAEPPRRIMLRGVLAAGASLLLPAALLGCESKTETDTTGSPSPSPGPEPDASPEPSAEPAKVSQASVQYQTQPKGEQKCADCQHFIAGSNSCKLVEGDISPDGWCLLWIKKS